MATQAKLDYECSKEEWQARLDLAVCYRIFDLLGWTESIYNHISVAVPGEEGAFLINPFGLLYEEVTASNLVKIDVEGNNIGGSPYMVNKAGFTQHAHFHKHLGERANAICHVHTTATMAVCSHKDGLLPTNFYACNFQNQIGYHDFEGVTVRAEEGVRIPLSCSPLAQLRWGLPPVPSRRRKTARSSSKVLPPIRLPMPRSCRKRSKMRRSWRATR